MKISIESEREAIIMTAREIMSMQITLFQLTENDEQNK